MTFEEVLLEAIEESMACLNEQTKEAFYLHLKNRYSLSKKDIPYRIEDFKEALEDMFQAGAKLLEIRIMMILFSKVGPGRVSLEEPESLEFTSYIYSLRNSDLCFQSSSVLCRLKRNCKL